MRRARIDSRLDPSESDVSSGASTAAEASVSWNATESFTAARVATSHPLRRARIDSRLDPSESDVSSGASTAAEASVSWNATESFTAARFVWAALASVCPLSVERDRIVHGGAIRLGGLGVRLPALLGRLRRITRGGRGLGIGFNGARRGLRHLPRGLDLEAQRVVLLDFNAVARLTELERD